MTGLDNNDEVAEITMTQTDINDLVESGAMHVVVMAKSDGFVCWDPSDSRDREPYHSIKKGSRYWLWDFRVTKEGGYTHSFANMGPSDVSIKTDVEFEAVYATDDADDPQLYICSNDSGPNHN
ncbi:hypothetical protein AB6D11_00075 [Vibrio splendidus]